MSSEYFFGPGRGFLSRRIGDVARKLGATLVNYTDPGCGCGRGCERDCPANRRHWFATINRGDLENRAAENRVMAVIRPMLQKVR